MTDFAKLTAVQLKAECTKQGLETTGKKAELVERLTSAASSAPASSSAASAVVTETDAAEPAAEVAATEEVDYSTQSVAELQALVKERGIKCAAKTKAAIIKALEKADAAKAPAAAEAAEAEEEEPKAASKGRGKRKAAEKAAPAEEEEEEEEAPKAKKGKKADAAAPATAAAPAKKGKVTYKVDPAVRLGGAAVYEDYDAMLNQTNIGANNNKFYRIQVLTCGSSFYCWTHWGRVGEDGQNAMKSCGSSSGAAIAEFEKKFKDKTSNKWGERANFSAKSGKYTLLEMDNSADDEEEARLADRLNAFNNGAAAAGSGDRSASPAPTKYKPSVLKPEIQDLMALLFDTGMFQQTMKSYEIDTAKMPLGKLSKAQIAKGFDILTEIEDAIKNNASSGKFNELSSNFYSLIPHDFGRRIPDAIRSTEQLKNKQDLLNVLNDIEIAQDLQAQSKAKAKAEAEAEMDVSALPRNPLDEKYDTLACDVEPLPKSHPHWKIIEKYVDATKSGRVPKLKIAEIYTINRHGEDARFAAHKDIKNRRLCWHGTSVAVVAAILNSGLRIMPHSGGRVGKGIYLADQHGKSSDYVRPSQYAGTSTAIMFLAEAALGEEHTITIDDYQLHAAPKGFDSIVARGSTGPDTKKDVQIEIDGNQIAVPQSSAIPQTKYSDSRFDKSEFLLYKESQHRIRFMIKFDWGY